MTSTQTETKPLSLLDQHLLDTVHQDIRDSSQDFLKVIAIGGNIFTKDEKGNSIANLFTNEGRVSAVEALAKINMNVLRKKDNEGIPPFIRFAKNGNSKFVVDMATPWLLKQNSPYGTAAYIFAMQEDYRQLAALADIDSSILAQEHHGINVMQILTLRKEGAAITDIARTFPQAEKLAKISRKMQNDTRYIEGAIKRVEVHLLALLMRCGFKRPDNFDALLQENGISIHGILSFLPDD